MASPQTERDLRDHSHVTHLTPTHSFHLTHFTSVVPKTVAAPPTVLPTLSHSSAPHRHPSLVLLLLPLPLFLSFLTLRKKAHPGSRWASFSTSSAYLSGQGLSRIQAPLVGLTSCLWYATSGATAAVLESIPLQTNDSWPRETAPHAPPRSHLMRPPGRWNLLTWSSSVRPSRPGAPSLHRT